MFTKRIIPCLDVHAGRVVKGVNFVDLRDAGDPVEIAAAYDKSGADELVFLDITASSDARNIQLDMVRRVAETVFIPFTVGGGIRSVEDFRMILREGADKIAVNSAAIDRPMLINEAAEKFGSQCVVVAIDAKRTPDGFHVFKKGGREDTGLDAISWAKKAAELGAGEILLTSMDAIDAKRTPDGFHVFKKGGREDTGLDAISWAKKAAELGAGEILLTSMDCDGTKDGYDLELTRQIAESVSIPVIASGGAGTMEHFYEALTEGKADAALAASLFHYKEMTIRDLKNFLHERGIPVRRTQ